MITKDLAAKGLIAKNTGIEREDGVDFERKISMVKKFGGYFTVEAAFLMPFVICIMALICYLSFYMCNRCLLVQDAYILGVRGSQKEKGGNEEIVAYILEEGRELITKYYAVSNLEKQVKAEIKKITVELKGSMKLPFAWLQWEEELEIGREWKFSASKEIDRTNPVEFIRACRKIEKLLGKE